MGERASGMVLSSGLWLKGFTMGGLFKSESSFDGTVSKCSVLVCQAGFSFATFFLNKRFHTEDFRWIPEVESDNDT